MTKKSGFELLHRTYGHRPPLPRALDVPVRYDRTRVALYRGGYTDVWKGEYSGQEVAVKVIRTYSNVELQRVINVSRRLYSFLRLCADNASCRGSARRS